MLASPEVYYPCCLQNCAIALSGRGVISSSPGPSVVSLAQCASEVRAPRRMSAHEMPV